MKGYVLVYADTYVEGVYEYHIDDIIMGLAVRGSSIVEYLQPTAFMCCWPMEDDGKVCGKKVLVDCAEEVSWLGVVPVDAFV